MPQLLGWLIKALLNRQLASLKMHRKSVHLDVLGGMTAQYAESSAHSEELPAVLVMGGFTTDILVSTDMVQGLCGASCDRRVVIMEQPGHGLNMQQKLHERGFLTCAQYVEYVKAFVDSVGLSDQRFDIIGYSYGGSHAFGFMASHCSLVRKCALLSPALDDCIGIPFCELIEEDITKGHAWVTAECAKSFFAKYLTNGVDTSDVPPGFIMNALVHMRQTEVPVPDYWALFGKALAMHKLETTAPLVKSALDTHDTLIRVLIPSKDQMIDPAKLAQIKQVVGAKCSEAILDGYGHLFGPAGVPAMHNTLKQGGMAAREFFDSTES